MNVQIEEIHGSAIGPRPMDHAPGRESAHRPDRGFNAGHRAPARPRWRQFAGLTAFVLVIGLLAAVNLGKPVGELPRGLMTEESADRQVLLLGDASAGQDGCSGQCHTYTQQLAASVRHATRKPVEIEDHTWRPNTWPPASVNAVAAYVRADPSLRRAVGAADVLVLAVTGTSPIGLADDLRSLLDEVDWIRQDRPVDLRVVIAPAPGRSGTWTGQVAVAGCQVVAAYAGACVNVSELVRLGMLTPADWQQPATGHPRLSQHGHDVVARELIGAGAAAGAVSPTPR